MEKTRPSIRSQRLFPPPLMLSSSTMRMVRSKSGSETKSRSSNYNELTTRSKSTGKARINKNVESMYQKKMSSHEQCTSCTSTTYTNKYGYVRLAQRGSSRNVSANKRANSSLVSPSAWALSPGRSSPVVLPLVSSRVVKEKSGGGPVGGVLRFFKQNKGSKRVEEEFHCFRVVYNRLLQWRFVNAHAEASISSVKITTEDKILSVWLRIVKKRKSIGEKKLEIQKLKNEIKIYQVVNPQLQLQIQWPKLEAKNCEAVSRLTRKLTALSVSLPLVQGAKVDTVSMYEAMSMALAVIDDMEPIITTFVSQVERVLFLVTELMSLMEDQQECFRYMKKNIEILAALVTKEKSLRVNLIQWHVMEL